MNSVLVAVRNVISGSLFSNAFGDRVYFDVAPGDSALPLCVYSADELEWQRGFDGTRRQVVQVSFTFAETGAANTTGSLASSRLKTLLDNAELSVSGYSRVLALLKQRGAPAFEDSIWTQTDVYEIQAFVKE